MSIQKTYDVAVIGAGVFGAWTAWQLAKRGQRVALIDAYGPAHSRASSGGETRIIRMGYGADELYTRWSQQSLEQWKKFFQASKAPLFHETGVLWLGGEDDSQLRRTAATLKRCKVRHEEFDRAALEEKYPQVSFEDIKAGILEPHSGVLMARRAVAMLVEDALPTWLFQEDLFYGMPDIESRGLKIAYDGHGERVDPDTQSRIVTPAMRERARTYVERRFPALKEAPIVETRVCQYENTSNGDFLIDQHPGMENVWFVGGGSGHGFKHGPALGEYVTGRLLDRAEAESRFSLATKARTQNRTVY